jgi:lipid-binding SYLF domain-containing protein
MKGYRYASNFSAFCCDGCCTGCRCLDHDGLHHDQDTASAPRADSTTVNTRANAALERLYQTAPGSKEMVQRAKGVLIFPSVIGGSFVVGVEHGRGVLRVGGHNRGFYSTTAASIGWQAGGQSKAVIYVFNTQEALDKFLKSDGWSVGADATVAAGKIGANGSVDTTTAQAPSPAMC